MRYNFIPTEKSVDFSNLVLPFILLVILSAGVEVVAKDIMSLPLQSQKSQFKQLASKRLKVMGYGDKLFKLRSTDGPKNNEESFSGIFEGSIRLYGIDFPAQTEVSVDRDDVSRESKKRADQINRISPPKSFNFVFEGWPCLSVNLRYGKLISCKLSKDIQFENFVIPAKTVVLFSAAEGSKKPKFLPSIAQAMEVNGELFEEGSSLKITENGVTKDFRPHEIDSLNGGD